jgi:5'-phosphate synthase pdxT subunit
VRRPADLERAQALILPGGESTTISMMLQKNRLFEPLKKRGEEGSLPILGTCAGMVVLAKVGDKQVEKTRTKLLELLDVDVDRNAFGRQRESFEADLAVEGFDRPLHAVFIRAPAVRRAFGKARVLASIGTLGVLVEQPGIIASAFHPELTPDTRVHEKLLRLL